mgnify:CR=1 FL=1
MRGMGAMIQDLCGNEESASLFSAALGKTIAAASLSDDALHLAFTDGSKLRLVDTAQSCCERRYMRTDDTLDEYVGATLTGGEVKPAPDIGDSEDGAHEVEFLEIQTSKGVFTMVSHNEHNGYYGGFGLTITEAE